ncbi:hypothetical protein H4R34_005539 [Dimargaris verticillata]|uniref:Hemolysin-III channel protein Izh2 n=1 Tax=Dimargaris verticillata TaxID=2761393 RepID=A0A9W8B0F0_9FUNG|nr:hypothetical protein H4R34_005539 [Dimargaris verticillata]
MPSLRHRSTALSPSDTAKRAVSPDTATKAASYYLADRMLLTLDELPAWMHDNTYILSGYRPPLLTYRRCFGSLFYLHNETGNIYSHLLGAVLFAYFAMQTASYIDHHGSTVRWYDVTVIAAFLVGAILCLSLSATFHLVACHSHQVSRQWNKCDHLGIIVLIVGSFYPPIYYAFYCHPRVLMLYLALISTFGLTGAYFCAQDRFQTPAYRWTRTLLYIGMGLSGALPLCHSLLWYGWAHTYQALSLTWFLTMGAAYVAGALIYACRVPERWYPGQFDYWLHSHQIFHLFVVAAAVCHYIGVINAFNWHHTSEPICLT